MNNTVKKKLVQYIHKTLENLPVLETTTVILQYDTYYTHKTLENLPVLKT